MDDAPLKKIRPVAQSAILLLANLTLLMIVSVSISVQEDNDPRLNSASPVTDGTINVILLVMALVLVNGGLLCLSPHTRRYGVGAIVAVVASIPVGILVSLYGLASLLGDS